MNEQISQILDGIKFLDGQYKRDLIDQAVELKGEITPYLVEILENVRDNPEAYAKDINYFAHNYALMLLGHFKEPKAHGVIVDLFSLPDDLPDMLFGELVTEDLPVILINTCDGSLQRIKELILNREADEFCRVSAVNALTYAVLLGFESRKDVLSFLCGLFTGDEAAADSEFWSFLALYIEYLYPDECMETIKKAYQEGLVSPGVIRYESFEKTLKNGQEKSLERLKDHFSKNSLDDIHKSMSWWACFNEDGPTRSAPKILDSGFNQTRKVKKKKIKKKKKGKLAKKSRRKNR